MKIARKAALRLLVAVLLPSAAWGAAESGGLETATGLYKQGSYLQAVRELDRLEKQGRQPPAADVAYLRGACLTKLQEFGKATKAFVRAVKLGVQAADVHFELGQAHYANRDLQEAKSAFEASRARGYKPATSLYYVAYIDQVLERFDEAITRYQELASTPEDPERVRQPSAFQEAEIRLVRAEAIDGLDRKKEILLAEVIPQYERAMDFDPGSPLAEQSRVRIVQIRSRHFKDAVEKRKSWSVSAGQTVTFDTNVTTQADQALVQLSNTSSLVFKTTASGSVTRSLGSWRLTPALSLATAIHSRRGVGTVIQNDSIDISPRVGASKPHRLWDREAALLVDYTFDYYLRDYTQTHRFLFYNTSHTLSLGEQLSVFDFGASSLSLGYKILRSEDDAYSARTPSLTLAQAADLGRGLQASFSLTAELQKATSATNDLNTYRLTNAVAVPDVWKGIRATPSLTISAIDTRNQSSTRGTETLVEPALGFGRSWPSGLALSLDYGFTKRYSRDKENYSYRKHTLGLGLTYSL